MEKFVILGTTLQYSTPRMNYFGISDEFNTIAAQAEKQFREGYKKFGSLKNVYDQFSSLLFDVLAWVDDQALKYIKRQEIYSVSRSEISAAGQSAVAAMKSIYQQRIMDPYEAIQHKKEAEVARREFKKKVKSNDLWDSIGYTALNAVGNMGSSISAGLDADSVYRNEETLRLFIEELRDYILSVMVITTHLVEKNSNISYDTPSGEEFKRAKNLEQNILNGSVPADKCDQMALQVLQVNPRAFALYDFLLDHHGDADHELERMAACFGYKDFIAHKAALLREAFAGPLSRTYTDEQDVLSLKKQVSSHAAHLGVSPEKELAILDKQWADIDRRLRTANGKEYETREQAQDVRDDLVLRDQKASSYDLKRINFLDGEQMQRLIQCLTDLPYKSADVPQGIPAFVNAITRQAVDRCMAIDTVHAPNDAVEGCEKIWSFSPIFERVASKMKFGPAGMELLKKYAPQLSLDAEEPLCLCQDITKLLSSGKLLVITTKKLYVVHAKDIAAFALDDILAISPQDSGCSMRLKGKPSYQTPFLIKLSVGDMEQYIRLLFNTVEALRLRDVPYESIYVPVDDALAAEPQPLSGLTEATVATVSAPKEEPVSVQVDGKTTIDDKDDKRLAYAKALVACGGTPEGIQAAFDATKKDLNATNTLYTEELKKNPKAQLYHTITLVGLAGFLIGLIAIFLVSLFTGLAIAAVSLFIFNFADNQEKHSMTQASTQCQEVQARKEEALARMKACREYLKAKEEAEEKGITPADVQDLIVQLTMQG